MTFPSATESCGLSVTGHTSWGQDIKVSRFLDQKHRRQLGFDNSTKGLQPRIQFGSSSFKGEDNQDFKPSTTRGIKERSFGTFDKKCNRTTDTRTGKRGFLFDFFCGTQKVGRPSSDPESEAIKQPSEEKEFQNGNSPACNQSSQAKRLASSSRSERCILAHTDNTSAQKIPQIQDRQSVVPIQGTSLWSYSIPSCLHQGASAVGSTGKTGGDPCISLPRRLANKGYVSGSNPSQDTTADGYLETSRFHNKPGKIKPTTISGYGVRGGEIHDKQQHCSSSSREIYKTTRLPSSIQTRHEPPSGNILTTARPHGGHDLCGTPLSSQNETDTIVSDGQMGHVHEGPGSPGSNRGGHSSPSRMVERQIQCTARSPYRGTPNTRSSDDGCVTAAWLGGSFSEHGGTGYVEPRGIQTPYQSLGNGSSIQNASTLPEMDHRQGDFDKVRQRYSGILYQQRRGDQISQLMYKNLAPSTVGTIQKYYPESGTHSGGTECQGRCPKQIHGIPIGVAPMPTGSSRNIPTDGQPINRPVCDSRKQTDSSILFQVSGQPSIPHRQPVDELGGNIRLCISPNLFNSTSPREDREIHLHRSANNSILAQEILVPKSPRVANRSTNQITEQTGSVDTSPREIAPSLPRQTPTSGLETERQSLLAEGLSEEVVDTIQHSIRGSSARCYDRMWAVFVRWCNQKNANPSSAPLNQVLAFLQSLVNQGLAYRTIGVYRSAISKFHDLIEGVAVGQHPRVTRFMRGAFLKNPPSRTLIPTWDVNIVLKFLCQSPFEPLHMASIQSLTLKTAFLVALASARRCSELHALGRSSPYIQFNSKGVQLCTVLGFLPKTANPKHIGETIFLPYNTQDPELCVVRVLKHYIKVTNARMRKENVQHNKLFVCYGHRNRSKPVNIRTISGWIVKIIEAAYAASGKSLVTPVRAHSTRGQATSRALFNGAPFKDVMQAADWRCQSTFIKKLCPGPQTNPWIHRQQSALTLR